MNEATFRHALLIAASPVTPLLGKIQLPVTERAIHVRDCAEMAKLKPGTVLLSRKQYQLTNFFIHGDWKHASIYCGMKADLPWVVEAVWPRVRCNPLEHWGCGVKDDPHSGEDYVLALEPLFADDAIMQLACDYAWTILGAPYDTVFEFKEARALNRAFYCSEVVWWCYEQAMKSRGLASPFTPLRVCGTETVQPSDFALAKDHWRQVGRWGLLLPAKAA